MQDDFQESMDFLIDVPKLNFGVTNIDNTCSKGL